ncbi:hypothetical protein BU16DRAFT_614527 [Lophium mytilinum]|uniref:Uncharacterized protein n=1 Tax=Lophium mytilinum TaxID=390894 RepID=A0A6A6R7Q1_9PEZI|nr:hypothetical protein BU16DRAFT_614527 [Lophium mytilinum]
MASTDNNELNPGTKRKAEASESIPTSKRAETGDDIHATDSEYESEESDETEIITTSQYAKISHNLYPFKRIDAHPHLPAASPASHAHVVEASSEATELSLADGVATVIWNYNPKALEIFLDPNVSKFEFTVKYPQDSEQFNYAIVRTLTMVKAGMYRTLFQQGQENHTWKNLAQAKTNYSGAWEPILGRESCRSIGPWWSKGCKGLHMVGVPKRQMGLAYGRTSEDEEEARVVGGKIAATMISKRVWVSTAEVTIAVKYVNPEMKWVDLN